MFSRLFLLTFEFWFWFNTGTHNARARFWREISNCRISNVNGKRKPEGCYSKLGFEWGYFNGLQFNFMHQDWKVRESVNVCLVEKKNFCSLKWDVPHVPRLECNGHYSHVNPTAFKDLHNNNTLPSVVPESQERWLFIPSIRYLVLLQLLTTTD